MNTYRDRYQQSLILLADEPKYKSKKTNTGVFKSHHRIDEAVISISRAAFSAGIGLILPYDSEFVPLVVQLAAEYISPRFAEGGERDPMDEKGNISYAVRLVDMGHMADSGSAINNEDWINLLADMGVVSGKTIGLEELTSSTQPKALILVGSGNKMNNLLIKAKGILRDKPIFAFHSCEAPGYQTDKRVTYFDDEIIAEIEDKRKSLRPIEKEYDVGSAHQHEVEEERFIFTPYPLIAQLLISKINDN